MDFNKKPTGITHCQTCGKELTNKQKNSRQRYCNRNCSPWPLITERYICKACGKEFKPNQRENITYCSKRCSGDGKRKSNVWHHCKVYFPVCEICGKQWATNNPSSRLCSDDCKKEYARRWMRIYAEKKHKPTPRRCKRCLKLFIPDYGSKAREFCTRECLIRYYRKKRKQLLRANAEEYINDMEIFHRDGFKCQICGKKVCMSHSVPHPKAPTLDHIIPLVLGGTHEVKNLQTAHFRCNVRKGGRDLGQLRLI